MPRYLDDITTGRVLPIIEFAVGSAGLSRRQALIELGFPEDEVDQLMEDRKAEDFIDNRPSHNHIHPTITDANS